jgi:hypothetical protein
VFKVDAPIWMRAGVQLAGTGLGTVLQRAADTGTPMISFADDSPVGAAGVRDLWVIGLKGRYGKAGNHGIVIPERSTGFRGNVVLTNVLLSQHAGTGVISQQLGCRLEGVLVQHSGGDGIHLDGSDSFAHHCQVSDSDSGYRITGGNSHVASSYAYYNNASGFVLAASRAVVSACAAQDNQPDGFLINTTGATVTGCLADTNRVTNFHLGSVKESALTGLSSVWRPGARFPAPPTGGGIRIDGPVSGVLLTGVSPTSAGGVVGSVGAGSVSQIVS